MSAHEAFYGSLPIRTAGFAARYQFEPMGGKLANGEQVAAHLDTLFRRHGAPLLHKCDNGSNLNDNAVNEVLAHWRVILLNSPVRCPEYNGNSLIPPLRKLLCRLWRKP